MVGCFQLRRFNRHDDAYSSWTMPGAVTNRTYRAWGKYRITRISTK